MIKVLMAAPYEPIGRYKGGISTVANGLVKKMQQLEQQGVRLIPLNTCQTKRSNENHGKLNIQNLRNLYRLLQNISMRMRKDMPDVFYLHSSRGLALLKDLLVLRYVKKRSNCKTVLHIHFADLANIWTEAELLNRWMLRTMKRYADQIVFLSGMTIEQFVQQGIPREKCRLIYNFSSMEFEQRELESRACAPVRSLLFVGAIREQKGIFDILEVLQNIDRPYTLHVCGTFEDEAAEKRFRAFWKSIGEKIQYHGFVSGEEKVRIFRDADVLLLPSYSEGLPMVVLEGFNAGCGVIVSGVGSVPEVVSRENGVVIEPGDLGGLRNAIETYLTMDAEALRQQQMHNHQISLQYTLEEFSNKIAQVCKEVCT